MHSRHGLSNNLRIIRLPYTEMRMLLLCNWLHAILNVKVHHPIFSADLLQRRSGASKWYVKSQRELRERWRFRFLVVAFEKTSFYQRFDTKQNNGTENGTIYCNVVTLSIYISRYYVYFSTKETRVLSSRVHFHFVKLFSRTPHVFFD